MNRKVFFLGIFMVFTVLTQAQSKKKSTFNWDDLSFKLGLTHFWFDSDFANSRAYNQQFDLAYTFLKKPKLELNAGLGYWQGQQYFLHLKRTDMVYRD